MRKTVDLVGGRIEDSHQVEEGREMLQRMLIVEEIVI